MLRIVIYILAVVGVARSDCPRNVDPCSSSVYVELDEPTRSTAHTTAGFSPENDYGLATNWYRPVSGAGGDMPTSAVATGECNAYAPIWLTEDLPSEGDGIVDIPACATFGNDDCVREYTVPVKNCGDYKVYCLSATVDGFDRYCMGSELPCDYGYWSPNGFTPGCIEEICPRDVDPCSSDVYTELDEPSRSTAYPVISSNSDNDFGLESAWYRATSGAGGDMPLSPVTTGHCNAYAPVWLNGALPEEGDGIVDLQACASFLDDTCIRDYTVPVKNCGDYNVYCLSHTDDAFDRFCMGSELECPTGLTSPTGFTPDCTAPTTGPDSCSEDVDPCSEYVCLDEPSRSTASVVQGTSSDSDYGLAVEWYRAVSGAGGDMPTEPVYSGQCNSFSPIWLNGTLPAEGDGIVTVPGCSSLIYDECVEQYDVRIKNCGDFNVYCLPRVQNTFERFCFGSESASSESSASSISGCTEVVTEATTPTTTTSTTTTTTTSTTTTTTTTTTEASTESNEDDDSDEDDSDKKGSGAERHRTMIIALCLVAGIALLVIVVLAVVLCKSKRIVWSEQKTKPIPENELYPPVVPPVYQIPSTKAITEPPPEYTYIDPVEVKRAQVNGAAKTSVKGKPLQWSSRPSSAASNGSNGSDAGTDSRPGSENERYTTPFSRYGMDITPRSGSP